MNLTIFCFLLNKRYVCDVIVYEWANQILPQILTEQSDTLFSQCRYIEHLHEEV